MKLIYSNTSPYSRKVRMVVIEKGLDEQVEMVACNPFNDAAMLKDANPLAKVPVLILDEGNALYDSPVICEYLDTLLPNTCLIPKTGPLRWEVLRWQALADGILDSAYNVVMEQRRAEHEQSSYWLVRWQTGIKQALDEADARIQTLPETINLAHLAIISALGYLDFRLPSLAWQAGHASLAAWFKGLAPRLSVTRTRPE